jgi:hypothetical protein
VESLTHRAASKRALAQVALVRVEVFAFQMINASAPLIDVVSSASFEFLAQKRARIKNLLHERRRPDVAGWQSG